MRRVLYLLLLLLRRSLVGFLLLLLLLGCARGRQARPIVLLRGLHGLRVVGLLLQMLLLLRLLGLVGRLRAIAGCILNDRNLCTSGAINDGGSVHVYAAVSKKSNV